MRRNLFSAAPLVLGLSIVSSIASLASAKTWMQDQDWTSLQEVVNIAASGDTIACIGEPIDEGHIVFYAGKDITMLTLESAPQPSLIVGDIRFDGNVYMQWMNHHGTYYASQSALVTFNDCENRRFWANAGDEFTDVNEVFGGSVKYDNCLITFPIYAHEGASLRLVETDLATNRLNWPALRIESASTLAVDDGHINCLNWSAIELSNGANASILDGTISGRYEGIVVMSSTLSVIGHTRIGAGRDGIRAEQSDSYPDVYLQGVELNARGNGAVLEHDQDFEMIDCSVTAGKNGVVFQEAAMLALENTTITAPFGYWCDGWAQVDVRGGNDFDVDAMKNPDSFDCDLTIY